MTIEDSVGWAHIMWGVQETCIITGGNRLVIILKWVSVGGELFARVTSEQFLDGERAGGCLENSRQREQPASWS